MQQNEISSQSWIAYRLKHTIQLEQKPLSQSSFTYV